jgi:hypothetical protein
MVSVVGVLLHTRPKEEVRRRAGKSQNGRRRTEGMIESPRAICIHTLGRGKTSTKPDVRASSLCLGARECGYVAAVFVGFYVRLGRRISAIADRSTVCHDALVQRSGMPA